MADVPEGGDAQGDVAHGAAEEPWQGKERAEELFPAWLSRHRVSVPEPPVRHLVRPDLLQRCMPTNQRVTLLQAGGGFGKTTLLAECCRTLRARGVPTAWLSLDERDDPVLLDNYLALAFQHAGIDVLGPLRSENTDLDVPSHRTALLARAMETHPGSCVLVLDELEGLRDPRSVALLNSLLQSNPDGLHVALACRELPVGLDVGTGVLSGQAALLTTEDMRFSRAEIAVFRRAAVGPRTVQDNEGLGRLAHRPAHARQRRRQGGDRRSPRHAERDGQLGRVAAPVRPVGRGSRFRPRRRAVRLDRRRSARRSIATARLDRSRRSPTSPTTAWRLRRAATPGTRPQSATPRGSTRCCPTSGPRGPGTATHPCNEICFQAPDARRAAAGGAGEATSRTGGTTATNRVWGA